MNEKFPKRYANTSTECQNQNEFQSTAKETLNKRRQKKSANKVFISVPKYSVLPYSIYCNRIFYTFTMNVWIRWTCRFHF